MYSYLEHACSITSLVSSSQSTTMSHMLSSSSLSSSSFVSSDSLPPPERIGGLQAGKGGIGGSWAV